MACENQLADLRFSWGWVCTRTRPYKIVGFRGPGLGPLVSFRGRFRSIHSLFVGLASLRQKSPKIAKVVCFPGART